MERLGTVEEAFEVFKKVPELDQYLSIEQMREKIQDGALILVSENKGQLIGFKIGYPLNDNEFYSWLGGVIPEMRKLGSAKRMLALQEKIVRERSFTSITVKSMNRFRSMLHMLLANDYDITAVENYGNKDGERICFKKVFESTYL
ncbi:GNAT family N-acetyltransferase [Reinekea sp. G2M2-21]|uniref:GNAT family N-acetyltransferase n=1 Tax=Reinekea sp. G2M2-21 TaxID=2788942 RepID=UPI0018AA3295|nr:GNAT family N-acetyltransferase [Reinekea sp. G2M2-21]